MPRLSVGMPVFNGGSTIAAAIESLLNQSFTDFELLISDNASDDATQEICQRYAAEDARIRYVRQAENLGAWGNFLFVYEQSKTEYFMWAAADDRRTAGFMQENIALLECNPDAAFSSSPHCWQGDDASHEASDFQITGSEYQRYRTFMEQCFDSHACFYSIMRRRALADCSLIDEDYVAIDWTVNLHLLSKGPFLRTDREKLILGRGGASQQPDFLASFGKDKFQTLFPWYRFTRNFLRQVSRSDNMTGTEKVKISLVLVRFNMARLTKILLGR